MFAGKKVREIKKVKTKNEKDPRFSKRRKSKTLLQEWKIRTRGDHEEEDISREVRSTYHQGGSMSKPENGGKKERERKDRGEQLRVEKETFRASLGLSKEEQQELVQNGFLYLKMPIAAMLNSVYELEVCSYGETNKREYFTISNRGVTHFAGDLSEFTELSTWEHEYKLFYDLKNIFFFSKFRLFKNFYLWRNILRREKISKAKSRLASNLFFLNSGLRKTCFNVRDLLVEIGQTCLFDCSIFSTLLLDDFRRLQDTHQQKVEQEIEAFTSTVKISIKSACEDVLAAFFVAHSIHQQQQMSYMERSFFRKQCRKLARYILLMDFMISDALCELAIESTRRLCDLLHPIVKPETKIIITEEEDDAKVVIRTKAAEKALSIPLLFLQVGFIEEEPDANLSPLLPEITQVLSGIVKDGLSKLHAFQKLILSADLEQFTRDLVEENENGIAELNFTTLVQKNEQFIELQYQMLSGVAESFDRSEEYAEIFTPFRETFLENQENQENQVKDFRHLTISEFEDIISCFQGQQVNFETIPIAAVVEIFKIDSKELKAALLPSPLLCLSAVKLVLPKIMRADIDDLMLVLNELNVKANESPIYVKDFTRKCVFLQQTKGGLSDLDFKIDRVCQLARLIESQRWKIPDDEVAGIKLLKTSLVTLSETIALCEARKEEDTEKFVKQLMADIPRIEATLIDIQGAIMDQKLANQSSKVGKMTQVVKTQHEKLAKLKADIQTLNSDQTYLELDVTDFEALDEIALDLKIKYDMWHAIDFWQQQQELWLKTDLNQLDAEEIDREIKMNAKVAQKAIKSIPDNTAGDMLRDMVDGIKGVLPLVSSLRTSSLETRHWAEIDAAVGFAMSASEGFTLSDLLERKLDQHAEEIQSIAVASVQEKVLEGMLEKIDLIWQGSEFEVNHFKEQKDVFILGGLDEIVTNLEDSLVTISTVMGSRFVAGIKDLVNEWKNNLNLVQETIDEWLNCQRNWIYLESIFNAADIQRQLPSESKKFQSIDAFFKQLMKKTFDEPNVLKACTRDAKLKDNLKTYNEELDKIQKSLEDYLETKRSVFPRFYFLSNDELLEILSQTKDVQCVQPHLRKCFDALTALDFGPEKKSIDIFAMFSPEGERIPLGKNLKARGNVEDWLTQVENHMRVSLQKLMKVGLLDYSKKPRKNWVLDHPGQVVATVAQICWAEATERSILDHSLPSWFENNLENLQDLITLIRSDLSKRERMVIVALVTTDVHARDIIETLKEDDIDDINNFVWQMQLRYYFNFSTNLVDIRHSDAFISYGYEYEGCTSRLVITPLTDRCWLTITGALNLKLGAAPAGPAGTGKTESSKDLAKALGVQCIVFNCSDQIDYKMMGKLFRGLAQTGAWTCLDEFNRIDIEVLSVVAQQLLILRQGRLEVLNSAAQRRIVFMGIEILLKDHHVIVTMNPGYAGRTELPDNLKICFRPVSMMVPDYALIAEIMLFAEGFGDAKTLSRKMIKLFHLSSQQLSQQPHYDYGLRAVKSVLVMAGSLKRDNPYVHEDITLIRALQDSNVPKCLKQDLPLFFAIVTDLFPNVHVPEHDYGVFKDAILEELEKEHLQPVPQFVTKVMQQFDIFNIRFGATIVGPTLSGKTTCYKILKNSMLNMKRRKVEDDRHQNVVVEVLNPKCISMGELYGEFNDITQEWQDGLASTIMRKAVNDVNAEYELIHSIQMKASQATGEEANAGSSLDDAYKADAVVNIGPTMSQHLHTPFLLQKIHDETKTN